MSAQPGIAEVRGAPPMPHQNVEAPSPAPKNPNREILNRRPSFKSEPEHVMAVIAKSKSTAIETGSKQKNVQEPLDVEIASYGFLTQLRSGDTFTPPIRIELQGVTYSINEVFTNQDGTVMLRNPTGGSVELTTIVGQTADRIRGLLPAQSEGESAQISFVRSFMESLKPGAPPIDQTVLKEAARSCGLLLNEDVVAIAQQAGIITGAEASRLLHPTEPSAQNTGTEAPNQTESPLSTRAAELQKTLGSGVVLTQEQVQAAFDLLGVPYSRATFIDQMRAKEQRLRNIPILIDTAKQSGKGEDAIKLNEEYQTLTREFESFSQIQDTLSRFRAGNWNAVESYYDAVESGEIPPESARLPALLDAFQQGDDQAILNAVGDTDTIRQVKRQEALKKLKENSIKAVAVIGGLNAVMIFLASRKKNE